MAEEKPARPQWPDMIIGAVVGAGVMIGLRILLPDLHRSLGDLVTGGLAGVVAVLTMHFSHRWRTGRR